MTTLKQILCAIINFGHPYGKVSSSYKLWVTYAPQALKILEKNFNEQQFYKYQLLRLNTCPCGKIFESKEVR